MDYKDIPELYQVSDIALHYPLSDATPVSMLEALSVGCLILCNPKIEAYKDLSRKFKIFRKSLKNVDEGIIESCLLRKEEISALNRKVIIEDYSDNVSVEKVREIFKK